ncbi:MAG: EAL domain-containing protein, partial [Lachnospiraceae bacterium]|nr:EAL domain-containing protein [Lachnospiraceae bacterium]
EVGYPPENLCLEITERCRFLDMERLMAICCDLNRYGIKVALDDFGTGFSSLSILQSLHIDILKIDRQFVKDIVRDNRQERLVRSIGKVGEIFGSRICVEGVETEEMRDILRKFDVYTFQGYLYSKPIPHREFMKRFVEKHADAEQ